MGNLKGDIRNYSTIAIDTNLFVYLMEKHPEYLENVSVIFRMIESGNCSGITSVLQDRGEALISQGYSAYIR